MEQKNNVETVFVEEESNFDIMEWVFHIIDHWYLFLIGILVSLGLAYLKNRSWIPSFQSVGTMIIQENRGSSSSTQALMEGFGVDAGYKNEENQVVMLKSYDLLSRVIDSLPQLNIDYISKGKFKTRNLYGVSPLNIQYEYIAPDAYGLLFKIETSENGNYSITVEENDAYKDFKLEGQIGKPLQHNLFFLTVYPNTQIRNNTLYFTFRDKESLISDFMSRLNFQYVVEGSTVLQISLESQNPERDIDFINMLSSTFLAENLDRKNDAANKTIKFIDSQILNVSKSLAVSEGEMTNFRKKNQILDVSTHSGELLGKVSEYDNQLSMLNLKETYLNYLTNYLKTNLEDGSVIAPSSLGISDGMLMPLVEKINDLRNKRSELTEKNVYYGKYSREIEIVKSAINEVTKNMRVALKIERNDLQARMDKAQAEINKLSQKEFEMVSIERKYKMDDSYYTFFLQKRAEAEILKSSNTPDNDVLDKARVLSITNGDTKSKTTMSFLLFGILIPLIIVIAKQLLNNTIKSPKDVEKVSPFQVVGMVRRTKNTDPLLVAKNPRSSFTELFRVLRTRIEFIVQRKKDIMIMISSCESGDGKTYFCLNLASIYAMASPKTILVDMDIRKPSVNGRFNIAQAEGVTNYLIGENNLEDYILRLPGVGYDILPAGSVPPNAGELIRSEKLLNMFKELRTKYDYIIVDTSPIGVVADAYSLALQADVNLFIVRNEKTNKKFLKRITHQLKLDNVHNMYTVINDVKMEENRYSRYYSQKYTYGYGYGYGYTSGYISGKRKDDSGRYFQYYHDDTTL